ncbi:MAG: type IVB secretion system protein IcmH/DotU [Deltaproteobacteria bacterium]|jgi:type VI secretion system protein ImpK|nr:type IVB secretion system protein IcmH/DotU [Deltaproteobacteria bacterium]
MIPIFGFSPKLVRKTRAIKMANSEAYDSDKTVVKPLGEQHSGRVETPFKAVARSPSNSSALDQPYTGQQSSLERFQRGINPLLDAAYPLLTEIIKLRKDEHENQEWLRQTFETGIKAFEAKALNSDVARAQILAARYVLCTALDESVTMSSMEDSAEWAHDTLLSSFHDETWGGEKSFQILERCMQHPAQNLYLLELIYVLISLGFEGRYRVMERGIYALEALRDKVFQQIRILRGEPILDLAKPVERVETVNPIHRYLPVWLVIILAVIVLAISFIGFSFTLNTRANQVFEGYQFDAYGQTIDQESTDND